eukprot:TRINITY_DN6105_c0_g1_i2.p1 TRINITY_DN6105_c0_g1~~TRINITY_DN6105_c0_g1_i2.p1  ORF type:complete len:361 (-),score=61.00 TRINITY_DN6105_c0_g1_i2:52-1134(-)
MLKSIKTICVSSIKVRDLRLSCYITSQCRMYAQMREKSLLTRKKATKRGMFDPTTYNFAPSPSVPEISTIEKKLDRPPVVAIVGRPNVGKSSWFNRLVGQSKSLVSPIAGTTRDRIYGNVEWDGWDFLLVDTGGLLGDTDTWSSDIHQQASVAMEEADVIIMICDVKEPISRKEKQIAKILRKLEKPVVVVSNKIDDLRNIPELPEYQYLGFGEPIISSAIHGHGEVSVLEALAEKFQQKGFEKANEENQKTNDVRIAIVGKPNVGKSSFLNRILGKQRSVVSDVPGTTSDPIDEQFIWRKGQPEESLVTLIDTAGMKKKSSQLADSLDHLSTLWALKVIMRCHVALLFIDAKEGVTKQV